MKRPWVGMRKRALITALLGAYILLQFSWWAWLLIRQHETIENIQSGSISARATYMILGEGAVFLALLTWGYIVIWKSLKAEQERTRKERHFLLAVTHELKTPIASTQLALETLEKHDWDANTKTELFQDANAGLIRLEQRVENILQNNRLISGKGMHLLSFDPEAAVESSASRYHFGAFRHRQIEIIRTEEAIGLIEGDEDALILAWGNLIENALKYSPENEPLCIRLTRSHGMFCCEFDDGGTGIPKAERKKVLQKFERLQSADSDGTGLGLYLANQIITMHGGSLEIQKSKRGGCRIITKIPLEP
ncbi:MAG: HAMP domain-containing sensor histidine kinase [Bacteroidetes bacterium]|nr:HAMP domain-containing sensor histidine kinase [Bacteroidota bacterium]